MQVVPQTPNTNIKIDIVTEKGITDSQIVTLEDVQRGVVPLHMPANGGEIRISGASLRQIEKMNPQTVLVLQSDGATMSVPITELSAKVYSQQFNVTEDDIRFHFIVHSPDASIESAVEQAVNRIEAQKLGPAIVFEIQVTGENGRTAFISTFNRYVTRTLTLPGDTVPATATGVWWVTESNEFHYVPTYFEKKNGKWVAVMKRQGASLYTVINRPVTFDDVHNHWGKAPIELLASKLIIEGRSKNAFAPDAPITRAEVASLLVRALGLAPSETKSPFTDISGGWYEQAVNMAYRAGLVSGYEDGTFRADQSVTREELVQMIVGAMNYTEVKPEGKDRNTVFTDAGMIAEWAHQAVNKASETGIIDGEGMFRPTSLSTRAETAAMLERMLKLVKFIQ
ncbi:S-layer homology domain-containing protein [Paenibacillus hexagrammi]|uniref:S-layer homology domain-containing protein n=1 Tax=Paenibacillus hexagrammi TaxID=2908839 RepID=A0ABY3SF67_9BACL|nr:S-layer homology domain-containing protein [Paenibacillus sp. YPD9-1]UJF32643.1 S-layer homology domain-containing protein [Paenibacillus sp. YPD9-1]